MLFFFFFDSRASILLHTRVYLNRLAEVKRQTSYESNQRLIKLKTWKQW